MKNTLLFILPRSWEAIWNNMRQIDIVAQNARNWSTKHMMAPSSSWISDLWNKPSSEIPASRTERRDVMTHRTRSRVSVSLYICATHIRGSGQFSGLSLPAGRKTHLDPSWVTPLRPWPLSLDKLTTIIPLSFSISPICFPFLASAYSYYFSFFLFSFSLSSSKMNLFMQSFLFSCDFSSFNRRCHLSLRETASWCCSYINFAKIYVCLKFLA